MDLCDKFKNMAQVSVSEENIRKICGDVQNFEKLAELSAFMRLLKNTN